MKPEASQAATAAAMRETFSQIAKLPPDQVIPYLTTVVQIGFELLRDGGKQDDFVRGLLMGATEQLEKPCFITMKDMRVN
ncbi:hypothetical protein IM816_05710 [Luteibacter flocculans]|uniref:Uncharacterized protein n=1 Tax=Luteibacter flocculans TaxID=2780091 RepID=A0ABY4T689_9GAMM|nr:hypothetical protein [Luteibacter flocculans]URL59592.1 hypothetical protein IM816_05710 [Luteibacter flocculans]